MSAWGIWPKAITDGTYRLWYACNNCRHKGFVSLPRGEVATARVCPNCGCHTFQKAR